MNWLHRLFNPHCEHCKTPCESCETLRAQLEIANYEKKQLLEAVLNSVKRPDPEPVAQVNYEQVRPKMIPWKVRQQLLEAEDRKRAQLEKQSSTGAVTIDKDLTDEIQKLEAELGVTEEAENGNRTQ